MTAKPSEASSAPIVPPDESDDKGWKWYRTILEQKPTPTFVMYRSRRPICQVVCGAFTSLVFGCIGIVLTATSSTVYEAKASYDVADSSLKIQIAQDIPTRAYFSYMIAGVSMNMRTYVDGSDPNVASYVVSRPSCGNAASLSDATWRRGKWDPDFAQALSGQSAFTPCGLVSLSVFTDTYVLTDSTGTRISMDETLAPSTWDVQMAMNKVKHSTAGDGTTIYTINGQTSWLNQSLLPHWQVWIRPPASPTVRNLWAVMDGTLKAGAYYVTIGKNSPIWKTNWGAQKVIIISGCNMFGNAQSMSIVGGFCLFIAIIEVCVTATIAVLAFVQPKRPQKAVKRTE